MPDPLRAVPDALLGLAPTRSTACPRCGSATSALANGRGRLDICTHCGTFEMTNPEGMQLFSLKGLELPRAVLKVQVEEER
ncbi:MAG: hypothetical protein QOE90_838 [Thermoplasmata archaeon]|jgi:ribosomal protein S27AE|nr:hypothetical protein [Thermoplasmata archaeon]